MNTSIIEAFFFFFFFFWGGGGGFHVNLVIETKKPINVIIVYKIIN